MVVLVCAGLGAAPAGLEKQRRTSIACFIRWGFEMGGGGGQEGRQAWPPPTKGKCPVEERRNKAGKESLGRNKPLGKGRARCGCVATSRGRARRAY